MISPPPIKPNAKIRFVSPAGKIDKKNVLPAVHWLTNRGYKVVLGDYIFNQHFQFAGTDEERLIDLQTALDDPDCAAIICSRGGYGTVRIIEKLDFSGFIKHPKFIVGYSDITILHLAINKLGFTSIHASMPPFFFDKNGKENQNLISLVNILAGKFTLYEFFSEFNNKTGKVTGEIIGGNLSIITSLMGTKLELETAGKILFIEEIDEYLYQIDRMIFQLKMAGKFKKLAGLIVGDFTNIKDNKNPFGQSVEEIIWEAVKDYNFPVAFGLKAGHGNTNLALPFGRNCTLDVSATKAELRNLNSKSK